MTLRFGRLGIQVSQGRGVGGAMVRDILGLFVVDREGGIGPVWLGELGEGIEGGGSAGAGAVVPEVLVPGGVGVGEERMEVSQGGVDGGEGENDIVEREEEVEQVVEEAGQLGEVEREVVGELGQEARVDGGVGDWSLEVERVTRRDGTGLQGGWESGGGEQAQSGSVGEEVGVGDRGEVQSGLGGGGEDAQDLLGDHGQAEEEVVRIEETQDSSGGGDEVWRGVRTYERMREGRSLSQGRGGGERKGEEGRERSVETSGSLPCGQGSGTGLEGSEESLLTFEPGSGSILDSSAEPSLSFLERTVSSKREREVLAVGEGEESDVLEDVGLGPVELGGSVGGVDVPGGGLETGLGRGRSKRGKLEK